MKKAIDLAIDAALAVLWFGGLFVGLLGDDMANRVVGMLLWLGIGVGYRLRMIQENTARS